MKRILDGLLGALAPLVMPLWIVAQTLLFYLAISSLWGWNIVAWLVTAEMIISAIQRRKDYLIAIKKTGWDIDKVFGLYAFSTTIIASLLNVVLIVRGH